MWSVLIKFFNYVLKYLLGTAVIKTILVSVFIGLYAIFWELLKDIIPSWLSDTYIKSFFDLLPNEMFWFFHLTALDFGFPLIFSAYIIRFAIRRLPVFG